MDTAEQLEAKPERLTWAEIRVRYPEQWVGLADVEWSGPGSLDIRSARVIGNGPGWRAVNDSIRSFGRCSTVRSTGDQPIPSIRPQFSYDEEARKALFREDRKFTVKNG